jgi:hypothetical protein
LAAYQGKTIKAYEIAGSALDLGAQVTANILTVKTLLAPLSKEDVKIVRCLGLNYSDHAVCTCIFFYTPRILTFIQAEANLAKPAYAHSLLEKYASP